MNKVFKYFFWTSAVIFLIAFVYLFAGWAPEAQKIVWGVNFSQKHAKDLDLDWKEAYVSILDDLKARNLKVSAHWDLIEPKKGNYDFSDMDWQVTEAEKRQAKLILIIGMKTSHWPECHIPEWAKGLSKAGQQEAILAEIREMVLRYKDSPSLYAWQPENEALFPFGECPWTDKEFLKKEAELVRQLDPVHLIEISDSGEGSAWFEAAKIGDVVGVTTYKKTWASQINSYVSYPLPSVFYYRKAQAIKALFKKDVWSVELQAEPWCPVLLYDCPTMEQEKTMNLQALRENIDFAKKAGFDHIYLWGAEWMYWMKTNQNDPALWEEAKKLF
ncbi:MAG: hypothetical protein WC926_01900 [Candidatus Paceibacterota bacterium]|jgi:hypothetical protein